MISYTQQIDQLIEDTRDIFMQIGEKEWAELEQPLSQLIQLLQYILHESENLPLPQELKEDLEAALSDLIELRSDIINFRIEAPKDEELNNLLDRISKIQP